VVCAPSHVYSAGIAPFGANALDVTLSDVFVIRFAGVALDAEPSASAIAGAVARNSNESRDVRMMS
jgi:hypothetical protein